MATAKKNTEIYEEVRCDFDAELLVKNCVGPEDPCSGSENSNSLL